MQVLKQQPGTTLLRWSLASHCGGQREANICNVESARCNALTLLWDELTLTQRSLTQTEQLDPFSEETRSQFHPFKAFAGTNYYLST